jgi:Fe-S cluster biosynthesis and repair protein YggX
MARMVNCVVLGKEAEGLDFPPYPGDLGKRVFENVSKEGWQKWVSHQTMLLNEYRLSPIDPKARKFLEEEMEKFFFGDLGVVAPFDPHPITGHSYLQYHLEGADPRDGDLDGPVVPLAPTNITIVPDPVDNAYNVEFTFPDAYLPAVTFELHSATNLQGFSGPVQAGALESLGSNRHQLKISTADSTLPKNFFRIEMSLAE